MCSHYWSVVVLWHVGIEIGPGLHLQNVTERNTQETQLDS